MQIKLWDDSEIIQDNSYIQGKGRVYRQGDREYSSVTTILSKVEDKTGINQWRQSVGEAKAEEIAAKASAHGTKAHNAIENHLKYNYPHLILDEKPSLRLLPKQEQERAIADAQAKLKLNEEQSVLIEPFQALFPYLRPVALEKRILWHDNQDQSLGFGGTADAYQFIDSSLLPGVKPLFNEDGKGWALTVLDWKNFTKRKRPLEYTRHRDPEKRKAYYPLIKYGLQLAAYSAAFNKLTDKQYRLNQGVLACAYFDKDTEQYLLDLYHFDQRSICWFWIQFRKILHAYYHETQFDWNGFCKAAHHAGVLGEEIKISRETLQVA